MLAVSAFGSQEFLLISGLFILSTVDFKKGAIVLHFLLWSFILTGLLKEFFLLPRPTDLEPSLLNIEKDFLTLVHRNIKIEDSPGFPSGHVISTVTFWIAVVYLFRGKFQKAAAVMLIISMPVSRMYLGRHFLGDVLGGLLIGSLIVITGLYLLNHSQLGRAFLKNEEMPHVSMNLALLLFLYFVILPLVLNALPLFHPEENGLWFGIHLYLFWMILSPPAGGFKTNPVRFLFVVSIYIGIILMLPGLNFSSDNIWITFTASAAPPLLSLLLTDSVFRLANHLRT
jgi:membrane-associated phospholipid phosphatase